MTQRLSREQREKMDSVLLKDWECISIDEAGTANILFTFRQGISSRFHGISCQLKRDGTLSNYKEPDLLYEIFKIRPTTKVWWGDPR